MGVFAGVETVETAGGMGLREFFFILPTMPLGFCLNSAVGLWVVWGKVPLKRPGVMAFCGRVGGRVYTHGHVRQQGLCAFVVECCCFFCPFALTFMVDNGV